MPSHPHEAASRAALTLMLISLAGIVVISSTVEISPRHLSPQLPYLKTIERPVVFEVQDVVGDGEDVPVSSDQTPEVDGFRWGNRDKRRQV